MTPLLRYILFVFTLLVWAGCAIRVAPTGGDKDTNPPKVLQATPDTFATNFNSKTIELEFDEYFQVNDLGSKLVVSPPLQNTPEFKIKGKKLILTLDEDLRPNTTYNFNFGAAISDVNENTPMSNYNYVFSTGSYIDSLSISGKISNAFSLGAEKDVTVLLYNETGDSLPYKSKPAYFAKTDDGGSFTLNYIAPGNYKIFALKETNNNYLYDSEDEQIAFVDTLVNSAGKPTITMRLFKAEKKKQRLVKNTFALPGKLTLLFNKPTGNVVLKDLKNPANTGFYITEYNTRRDSLTVWLTNLTTDTLKVGVFDNGIAYDTLTLTKKVKKGVGRGANSQAADTTLKTSIPGIAGGKAERGGKLKISFSHPVKQVNRAKIKLYSGNDTIQFKYAFADSINRQLEISYPFSDETDYTLLLEKGAFTDIFNYNSDSLKVPFTLRAERDYGSMQLNLTIPDSLQRTFILQLLNSKNDVLEEKIVTKSQKVDYGNLLPGEYTFRLIDDTNKNGQWDTGNYLEHIQPETVLYSSEKPNIRAAWDLTVEWDLSAKKPKK